MGFKVTDEMIKNSLVSKGDIARIVQVIKKAKSGQDITVAFFGGSITQGCNASNFEQCYASRTYRWFKNTFSDINVKYINAGVGATGSVIGVHRVENQVLSYNPDIVFIDFAVNDKNIIYDKKAYESLVRRILSMENPPAIVEVFMTNFDGSNVQDQQIEIGRKYNLPMISFRNTVYTEMIENRLKWDEVGSDEVHPNDYGHFIISELLIDFMKNIYNNLEELKVNKIELGEPLFGEDYINGKILNNNNLICKEVSGFNLDNEGFQVFKNGWKFDSTQGKEALLKASIEGNNIFLLFKKSIKDTAGKLEIKVDGNNVITVDTFFGKGWGDYSATQVLVEKSLNTKHEIEIRVINEDKPVEVNIMGFLVS